MKPRHCDPNRKRREKQPPPSKDKIQFETRAQARQNSGSAQAMWVEALFCLDLLFRFASWQNEIRQSHVELPPQTLEQQPLFVD